MRGGIRTILKCLIATPSPPSSDFIKRRFHGLDAVHHHPVGLTFIQALYRLLEYRKEGPLKTSTINLSLPGDLLQQADREAKRVSMSRSELMREALRAHLTRKKHWDRIFDFADEQVRRLGLKPGDVEKAVREARRR